MQTTKCAYLNQITVAVIINIISFTGGQSIGWLSPALPQLRSPLKPLGDITMNQSALLASAYNITTMIFLPIIAIVIDRYGRKKCLLIINITLMINGLIIIIAKNIESLIIGRLILGIGIAGATSTLPTYVGEIANSKIRGSLASFQAIFFVSGIAFANILGGFISYLAGGWGIFIIAVINEFFLYFIPETPIYLLKTNQAEKAIEAIHWLHHIHPDSTEMKEKIQELLLSSEKSKYTFYESAKILYKSKPLMHGFLICLAMTCGQGLMGMLGVHSYSVSIFMESGFKNLTPEISTLIYNAFQISGAITSVWLMDKAGRKLLMVVSCSGVAVAMTVIGIHFQLKIKGLDVSEIAWIPVVALSFCVFIYTAGAATVPFVLISDQLSFEVRSFATMILMEVLFGDTFLVLIFFEYIIINFGEYVLFYIFGVSSLITGILAALLIVETKGKTMQEVMDGNYKFKEKLKISPF